MRWGRPWPRRSAAAADVPPSCQSRFPVSVAKANECTRFTDLRATSKPRRGMA